jgi:phosphopantothenoylcysteine decarboxylase/phosphopantothenate--cysteine ligase
VVLLVMLMRFLVTAGNTREKIDSVRMWSNIFTGNTGLSITRALADVGEVELLTSNKQHLAELSGQQATKFAIKASEFTDHANLRAMLSMRMRLSKDRYDAVFMSAAVADYRPAGAFAVVSRDKRPDGSEQWIVRDVQAGKVKSSFPEIAILGRQTEKLVDLFRKEWGYRDLLVKFKLEVDIAKDELIRIGQASRISSGADYLVANTLDMVQGPEAGAFLLSEKGSEWVPRAELPGRMVKIVEEHVKHGQ